MEIFFFISTTNQCEPWPPAPILFNVSYLLPSQHNSSCPFFSDLPTYYPTNWSFKPLFPLFYIEASRFSLAYTDHSSVLIDLAIVFTSFHEQNILVLQYGSSVSWLSLILHFFFFLCYLSFNLPQCFLFLFC